MDTSNWRPTQGGNAGGGDSSMESGDWRTQLQADSRQRIVNKIMDTLKKHLPFSGQEGLQELEKIAVRFEEKIYTAVTSQSDYLRTISLKMLTMETRSQNPMPDAIQSNSAANSVNPSDPGSQVMQQVNNQGQPLPISVPSNHPQPGQQLLSQSIHNNISSTGMQGSFSLSSAVPPGSGLPQSTMANGAGQNFSLQNIQNMSGVQQNSVGNTMGSGVPANNFANERQIPGRQQLTPQQQQQQQPQNYLYQQQLHQIAKQKLHSNITPSMQSHIQQQQQQNLLQPGHLQSSQQSVMQPTMMQTSSFSTAVQNQQPVVPQSSQPPIQYHQQSVLRQQRQQQQAPIAQQQQQQTQSQPNPMAQQANATNMQQNQLIGQQNSCSDMQQQHQRLLGQQNKLSSVQQQPQQHLVGQQNNLSSMQQQHLGSQSGGASGQQQQLLGTQSGNSGMQTNQHPAHMLQSKIPIQQQNQQSLATLLPTQVQQSQPQLQQQVMSHIQSQSGQLQQQEGLQQQPNLLQRDMQYRLPTSGGFQQQNVIDQQKQLFQRQQQRAKPEASSIIPFEDLKPCSDSQTKVDAFLKLSVEERSFVGRHSIEIDDLESSGESRGEKREEKGRSEEEEKSRKKRGMARESPPKVPNVSAKKAAELERARLGREKRLKAMADALQNSGTTAPKESLVGASGSSRVVPPKGVGVASTEKVIKVTPINSAPPATKSPSAASSSSSVDKGKDHLTGEEKVTTVNFTLPSVFMSGNVLDGTNLFPHLEKFLLPSFRERFKGFPIEETGSHAADLVFMALQALLALRGGTARIKDLMSATRERENAALDRADVSANHAEDFSKRYNEALEHLKIVHLDKEDLSRRLAQSLSITAEQREEMDKVKESLIAASKEIENYKSQVEDLEKKVQAAEDDRKSVFSIARLTARAAIMRQHLRRKDPLASAKEELDVYLKDVGTERDLDSDDEKEEEMIGEDPQVATGASL